MAYVNGGTGGLGNEHTVNTWWYFLSQNDVTINVNIIRSPSNPTTAPTGPSPVCQGQTNIIYTAPVINSAEIYVWTLPDGSIVTTPTNQIALSFPTAIGGNLTVHGQNVACGNGAESPPKLINVIANPVPGIAGPSIACQGTSSTFTVTSGLTSYNWAVTGGTISGSSTTNTVLINWTGFGNQTVSVTTSSATCPNILTTKSVLINPQPNTTFNYSNNCAVQNLQFTDLTTITGGSLSSWSWNFGDPPSGINNTSTLEDPTHTYAVGGNYNVSLTVTSDQGCSKLLTQVVPVISPPTANAGSPGSVCRNATYTLTGIVTNNSAVSWSHTGTGTLSTTTAATTIYTPGGSESGNVTFTLTAIGNTPCGNATSQVVITVNPPATANAGVPATICQGSTFPLSAAIATNYSSLLWTRSGTGSFDLPTSLNPVYTPSAADITAGSVTLTLTANGLTACALATHSIILTISKQVIADAGINGVVCQNSSFTVAGSTAQYYSSLAWTHNGMGTLAGANTLHPVYTPGAGETGLVTLTLTADPLTACNAVVDQMFLTVNPIANAFAGPDVTICETGTIALSSATASGFNNLLWTTTGNGMFDNATTLQPIYTPGAADIAAGFVDLKLTSYAQLGCTDAFDFIKVSINKQAISNAGPDQTVCQNNSIQLKLATPANYSSLLWTHNGAGTITGPGLLMPTYTPAPGETGLVTFTLTAGGLSPCVDVSDQMQLTVNEEAHVNAGAPATICEGSTFTLAGSSASGYVNLDWTTNGDGTFDNASILHPTYTPGINDILSESVSLTIKAFGNPTCNDVTSVLHLSITRQVTANARCRSHHLPDVDFHT